ncbi:uncharacterized protein BDZ99DRAFT_78979 [Mytilinidion resinicola]|uniref:Uncharacterized protein n=1 Tax=Mytilinidion resinicola TaxID=574789 RepID=A0A6A6YH54_9PEZI|nr:uncharacterized protein BDZ99DRAFT_78979 [Mytilinidion resinicola]KAF2807334.1 hypothetical protein BDZ99DRAFT_78979 [Mytilinidion resinicola]
MPTCQVLPPKAVPRNPLEHPPLARYCLQNLPHLSPFLSVLNTRLFDTLYTYRSESTYMHNFRHLTPSIIIDTNPTMEANPTTDAKPTPGKSIPFDLDTTAITNLATEFFKPEKLTPLLQKYTTATTDLATKYLKPEKLTPLVQEHKSPSLPNISPSHTALTNLITTHRRNHRRRPLANPLLAIRPPPPHSLT